MHCVSGLRESRQNPFDPFTIFPRLLTRLLPRMPIDGLVRLDRMGYAPREGESPQSRRRESTVEKLRVETNILLYLHLKLQKDLLPRCRLFAPENSKHTIYAHNIPFAFKTVDPFVVLKDTLSQLLGGR